MCNWKDVDKLILPCKFYGRDMYSIQFIYFPSLKNSNTLKERTCTQQDGGGTTKSKSLKMLYPLYKQIVQYKHEEKQNKTKNTDNTNKCKQAKI